ncbi:MAG: serine hydrolase domain-containing protein, partial [Pseudomonadota bacterium]
MSPPAAFADYPKEELSSRLKRFEAGLRPALQQRGEEPVRWSLVERMDQHGVPGVSVVIMDDGEIIHARGYGTARADSDLPVDTETVFSVGSVSKIGAAMTAHALVAEGVLDLDTDVNQYLKRWTLPSDEAAPGKVITLRGLMSHTAGLNVHGFADFLPGEPLPGVVDVLSGRGPAKSAAVRVIHEPGSVSDYSGGGTTVTGLVISDSTGLSFNDAAQKYLFEPLGMTRST